MLAEGARIVHLRAKSALSDLRTDGLDSLLNATSSLLNGTAATTQRRWSAPLRAQQHGLLQAHDSESQARDWGPDKFVIYYWGAAILLVAFVVFVVQPAFFPEEDEESDAAAELRRQEQATFDTLDTDRDGIITKEEFKAGEDRLREEGLSPATVPHDDSLSSACTSPRRPEIVAPKEVSLPENMWALNLVAAIGQAKTGRHDISALFTGVVSLFMATLQISVLFLVVHDINPHATPVTTVSSDPWIDTGWTVNCMKWLMVTFMSVLMVTEAGECRITLTAILETNSHRLAQPRWFLMFICSFQYIIMLFVIWGGVAAVLSFQSVPDILYSSMSITYIAKVDEAFYIMLDQLLDLEADFTVVHGRKVSKMTSDSLWSSLDIDGDGAVTRDEFHKFQETQMAMVHDERLRPEKLSHAVSIALHFMAAFPCLLGYAMIGRAMYSNVMPTQRLHKMKDAIIGVLRSM